MKNLLTRRYTLPLFCLLCSFAVLAVCSRSSPLYATNDWVDANIYFTIGRGMHQGLMPYRDLLDHKGPLLYLLHWAAAAVSSTSFFGVWLLEVLAGWAFLYASARTLLLYCGRGWTFFSLPLLAACVYASPAFAQGDSAEEFCLPLLAIALYFFLACFGPGKQLPSFWVFALNGAAAGAIFWIKFTLLGLHFAWMACFAFLIWIGHRSFGRALAACGAFLGGMAVISVPILLPYALGGALPDLFQTYFGANLTSYATTPTHWSTPLYNLVMSGLSTALANPVWAVLALVGGVFFVLRRGLLHPAATAALLALGCHLCRTCQSGNCNWGIATQRPALVQRLDPDAGCARLVNLLTAWRHEMMEMMGGMGINSIEALRGNRLMLRGVGLTDRELRILGIAHAGE